MRLQGAIEDYLLLKASRASTSMIETDRSQPGQILDWCCDKDVGSVWRTSQTARNITGVVAYPLVRSGVIMPYCVRLAAGVRTSR